MAIDQLAIKFSNILIQTSKNTKEVIYIIDSIDMYIDIIAQNRDIDRMLSSPILSHSTKLSLMSKIDPLINKLDSKIIKNLFIILIKIRQTKLLVMIVKHLKSYIMASEGLTETKILFANHPSDKQLQMAQEALNSQFQIKPVLDIKIDKKIVAGFKAFFDGKMLDASLQKTFEQFANLKIQ